MMKKEEIKETVKNAYDRARNWCTNNKELIIAVAPSVIGGSIELIKIFTKRSCINDEKKFRNNYVYDRENGHYYELNRQPTSKEWLVIDHRKEVSDIPLGMVLDSMDLLK